jgi:hypothetical protein
MPDPYLSHLLSLSGPGMHRALAFAHVVQALGPLLAGSMAARRSGSWETVDGTNMRPSAASRPCRMRIGVDAERKKRM